MLKNNLQGKGISFLILPHLKFFKKSFYKKWCGTKDVCGKSCTFNSEKLLAFAICGECVVKVFSVAIMF